MKWEEKHDEVLKAGLSDGYSRSQVAWMLWDKFGLKVSRAAVIGRAYRLGICGPKKAQSRAEKRAQSRAEKIRQAAARKRIPRVASETVRQTAPVLIKATEIELADAWLAIPESRSISITELGLTTCRWPLWDGPLIGNFCGAECGKDEAYCPSHRMLSIGKGTPGERNALKGIAA